MFGVGVMGLEGIIRGVGDYKDYIRFYMEILKMNRIVFLGSYYKLFVFFNL